MHFLKGIISDRIMLGIGMVSWSHQSSSESHPGNRISMRSPEGFSLCQLQ